MDSEPEFYKPEEWRLKAEDKKHGSSDEVWEGDAVDDPSIAYDNLCLEARNKYLYWVNALNICPEQARMILPQSMKTEWYWSGTLMAFARALTSFTTLTVLMKNSLLEQLSQDYIRTAFAKGISEKRVVWLHAIRNSVIPIAAGIGHIIGIVFAGSYLFG